MYNVADYGWMIADRRRMQAFTGALRRLVTPDSVVVDIGTGTGIFAVLSAKLGARRVYAVEPESVIGLARQTAADNDLNDRIVFIQCDARRADIPEKADVVVSDIGGVLPWHGNNLTTLIHVLDHFLTPGGHMLPGRDRISAAVVEAPSVYDELFGVWTRPLYGIDLSPALQPAVNAMHGKRFSEDQLLSSATLIHDLDYQSNRDPNLDKEFDLVVERNGTGHGIAVWFDREVAAGFEIPNGPGPAPADKDPDTIYGHAFFPWPQPVPLSVGMPLSVGLGARLEDDDYAWHWNTDIPREQHGAHGGLCFRQTTARENAKDSAAAAIAALRLSEDGDITSAGLGLMQDGLTLGDIATRLAEDYPRRFPRWQDALYFAAELSRKFG